MKPLSFVGVTLVFMTSCMTSCSNESSSSLIISPGPEGQQTGDFDRAVSVMAQVVGARGFEPIDESTPSVWLLADDEGKCIVAAFSPRDLQIEITVTCFGKPWRRTPHSEARILRENLYGGLLPIFGDRLPANWFSAE